MLGFTIKIFALFNFFVIVTNGQPVDQFVSGNKIFTSSAYKEIAKTNNGNILFSPLSTEIVLAIAQSGAKGETGEEIRNNLHLPTTKENTETAIKSLLTKLKGDKRYAIQTANKFYVKRNLTLKEQFRAVVSETYQSDIENLDFSHGDEAASTINKWVEKHTNDKIHNIVSPSDFDNSTVAILINALHFKGEWQKPFSAAATLKLKFYMTPNTFKDVDMMNNDAYFNFCENNELNAQYLELPFKGEATSMVIVLPYQKEGISLLENQINKVFDECLFQSRRLDVTIPKFKVENIIDFKQILSSLGVKKAFDLNQADFSEIAGAKGDIHIDKIQQKSFIDVNEGGVEAAAATFISFVPHSMPSQFTVDHPFLFYIKSRDVILFAGRVSEP